MEHVEKTECVVNDGNKQINAIGFKIDGSKIFSEYAHEVVKTVVREAAIADISATIETGNNGFANTEKIRAVLIEMASQMMNKVFCQYVGELNAEAIMGRMDELRKLGGNHE